MRACDIFSGYVARTPLAHAKMVEWTPRPEEWVARTGWLLVAQLALHDTTLADAGFLPYLDVIESEIHARPNRVRDAMNNALIALALRSDDLQARVLEVAARIGKVEVDHGATGCKTPDAPAYIHKAVARKAARKAA